MIKFKDIICPISSVKLNENNVRFTAFLVFLIIVFFLIKMNIILPMILVIDFYIRAFTKMKYSLLSKIGSKIITRNPILIDKAPKVFAARVGLVLTSLIIIFYLAGMTNVVIIIGLILVLFSFLEFALNFCAGCWVYTYFIYPLVRKKL